jgi:hypothetical protein
MPALSTCQPRLIPMPQSSRKQRVYRDWRHSTTRCATGADGEAVRPRNQRHFLPQHWRGGFACKEFPIVPEYSVRCEEPAVKRVSLFHPCR